jgi:hypothetical protein
VAGERDRDLSPRRADRAQGSRHLVLALPDEYAVPSVPQHPQRREVFGIVAASFARESRVNSGAPHMTNCITCKRWKLFGEKPCTTHPDFETDRDKAEREEQAKWAEAEENLNALALTAALRTTAAMGRKDLFDNAWRNLQQMPETLRQKVRDQIAAQGPMTAEELSDSMWLGLALMRKDRA